jgi:hypothetical protein
LEEEWRAWLVLSISLSGNVDAGYIDDRYKTIQVECRVWSSLSRQSLLPLPYRSKRHEYKLG